MGNAWHTILVAALKIWLGISSVVIYLYCRKGKVAPKYILWPGLIGLYWMIYLVVSDMVFFWVPNRFMKLGGEREWWQYREILSGMGATLIFFLLMIELSKSMKNIDTVDE